MSDRKAYVVCCEPRVVLFGYASDDERARTPPYLHRPRMLVYWDRATRGIHGAAAHGPTEGCRVTPAAPGQTIDTKVEAWIECAPESVERWESGPWSE